MFPNAKISDRKLELNGTDLDLFLLHVFKHVVFYQRELARIEVKLLPTYEKKVYECVF